MTTLSPKAEYEALSPEEIAEAKRLAKFYDKLVDSERAPLIARALRIAAAQEGQESAKPVAWKDIATAPRTGEPIIVRVPPNGDMQIVRWLVDKWAISVAEGKLHYFDADRPTWWAPIPKELLPPAAPPPAPGYDEVVKAATAWNEARCAANLGQAEWSKLADAEAALASAVRALKKERG